MIRTLHRWPGLVAAILLGIIALSGAALSVYPAMEAMNAPGASGMSVAQLASRVQAEEPTVEQIRRRPPARSPHISTMATSPPPRSLIPEPAQASEPPIHRPCSAG